MNSETKKKIEDEATKAHDMIHDQLALKWEYAEYGYNAAVEQANEILVKTLKDIGDIDFPKSPEIFLAREALEAWKKLTGNE